MLNQAKRIVRIVIDKHRPGESANSLNRLRFDEQSAFNPDDVGLDILSDLHESLIKGLNPGPPIEPVPERLQKPMWAPLKRRDVQRDNIMSQSLQGFMPPKACAPVPERPNMQNFKP